MTDCTVVVEYRVQGDHKEEEILLQIPALGFDSSLTEKSSNYGLASKIPGYLEVGPK